MCYRQANTLCRTCYKCNFILEVHSCNYIRFPLFDVSRATHSGVAWFSSHARNGSRQFVKLHQRKYPAQVRVFTLVPLPVSGIIGQDGALAEKLGTGLQNLLDGSVTRTCLHFTRGVHPSVCFGNKFQNCATPPKAAYTS